MIERNMRTATWSFRGMLVISIAMTAEYARICLTTEAAGYRYFVLAAWTGILLWSLVRLVRRNARAPEVHS